MSRADEIEDLPDIDGDRPPRLTREIIGHDTAFDAFTQARSQGRLHHSWLLSGIRASARRVSLINYRDIFCTTRLSIRLFKM